MGIKITDLVEQETIDRIIELKKEIHSLMGEYAATAKELAKGIQIDVKVVGDLDKLEKLYNDKSREVADLTAKLNTVIAEHNRILAEQSKAIATTTNTRSRELMEIERVNKTQREAYTDTEKFKALLEKVNGSYEQRVQRLVQLEKEIKDAKDRESALNKELEKGEIDQRHYIEIMTELRMQTRALAQEKADLTNHLKNEEREAASVEGSYRNLSQRLELMRKAYKDLTEEEKRSPLGKEIEIAIQDLNAHLIDLAADMGEFQRNVGNYAIAGQNGVVTTESVIAAMNQEAKTAQDLIDQTKILEEAKMKLDKNDAEYQTTLTSLNSKLEENKRKISDVSDILNKDANSVAEAEAQNKRLQEALKLVDLSSDDAQQRIKELNDKIAANTRLIKENTPALKAQADAMSEQNKNNEATAGSLLNLIGLNDNFGSSLRGLENASSANVIEGLNTKVKAFAKTLMGLLANPWVLSFLGIAGVVAGFKWWYDYNKGLIEASRLTQNFTGLTGDAADKITTDLQAVADHMGKGFDDTIGAANTLVQQFGISWEEALTKIEDGIQAGADMNGRFVENINRFAPALRDAGVSVDEFVAILAETRNGIFDERGVQDILKGGTRLRAMTKQISESLDACGISSQKMQEDLASGNITMLEAVQQVASKLKELPENSQEAGMIMKNVFGRTAAEGGTLLIQSIADVNTNLDTAKESMGELGKLNREQMEAQKELNETLAAVFKMSGTNFEEMTLQAKTYITQGLTKLIVYCADIVNWFIRMYNKSMVVRGAVSSIVNSFKTLWEIAKFVLKSLVDSFKSMGDVVEGIVTLDWGKVKKGWKDGMSALGQDAIDMAKNIAANTADAFNNTINDEMKELSVELKGDTSGAGVTREETEKIDPPGKGLTDKEKKALEKAAKEELKRLQELEASKIAMMAEGHEKELALIRLKFKKKIEKITGDSETEKALRLQLAEQCQKEIADCELKYQTQLSKINLANRLATVEKGSKEELDLKLAQLEASRQAELKEAEKTGADVILINEKFNKQKLDLQEEYANKAAEKIMEEYSVEEITRNQAYSDAVNALKKRYVEEMTLAKGNGKKQEEIKKDYEQKLFDIETEYSLKAAQASVDMINDVLNLENLSAEDRLAWEKKLSEAKINLANLTADAQIEAMKRADDAAKSNLDDQRERTQWWLQKVGEALTEINNLCSAFHDNQIEKIESLQEANEEAANNEVDRISDMVEKQVITEEEGEARKRAAEERTAKKNEELEKKKAQIKYRQAIFDKALSVASVGLNTAMALMQLWVKPGYPQCIPMIPMVAALGALQLATVLATPIPKYAKGTDYHKGGPAIVGDGGRPEVVLFKGDAWLTPSVPTLLDMPSGASVIPDVNMLDSLDMLRASVVNSIATPITPTPSRGYDDTAVRQELKALRHSVSELSYHIKRQTAQQHEDAYLAEYERFKNSKI